MNQIQQAASSAVDFSRLIADATSGPLTLSGVVVVLGVECPVAGTFDPVEAQTVYAHADGTVNSEGEGAFAHVAWHDGQDWNVITHPAPAEPPAEPTE